jgi:hypothetical protein
MTIAAGEELYYLSAQNISWGSLKILQTFPSARTSCFSPTAGL